MDDQIPVTLVAGWHGSGKSTLVREVVRQTAGERLAVVVPAGTWPMPQAFLAVQTEEEVVHRVDGCVSCAIRHDIRRCLLNLMSRKQRPARIVVELTGWSDPALAAQTVMGDPLLARSLYLDGVVTVVDAASLFVRSASAGPLWAAQEQGEQVAMADRIVFSNLERLTQDARNSVVRILQEVNPRARVRTGLSSPDYPDLFGVEAFTASAAGQIARLEATGRSRLPSCSLCEVIEAPGSLDGERFDDWLSSLDHHDSSRLLKVSGVVAISGEERRLLCHRVGTHLCVCRGEPWGDRPRFTKLFVAGRHVPESLLSSTLQECAVA